MDVHKLFLFSLLTVCVVNDETKVERDDILLQSEISTNLENVQAFIYNNTYAKNLSIAGNMSKPEPLKEIPKVLMVPHAFIVSHMRLFYQLATELVARGYNVTILRWPATEGTWNLALPKGTHLLQYSTSRQDWVSETIDNIVWKTKDVYVDYIRFMAKGTTTCMKACLDMERNVRLMKHLKEEKYALGILDPHTSPCSWIAVNQLNIPYISIAPSPSMYYMDRASSTPTPMSYVPSLIDGKSDKMTLLERLVNILDHFILSCSSYWYLIAHWFRLLSIMHNKNPWINVSHNPGLLLLLTNTMIEFPKPLTLNQINIGLKDRVPNAIIDDLTAKANQTEGTIIFSLTTLGKRERMSDKMRNSFKEAFKQFPDYRFIWRTVESPTPKSDISNIEYSGWFNQTNLFAEKNTKLLITHGGIATVLEASRHGIPMLGMPMAFDHHANVARVVDQGLGVKIFKRHLTGNNIAKKISQLLNDKKIYNRAQKFKEMLDSEQNEKQEKPIVWMTEYAIRHGEKLEKLRAKGEAMWTIIYFNLDFLLILICVSWAISVN